MIPAPTSAPPGSISDPLQRRFPISQTRSIQWESVLILNILIFQESFHAMPYQRGRYNLSFDVCWFFLVVSYPFIYLNITSWRFWLGTPFYEAWLDYPSPLLGLQRLTLTVPTPLSSLKTDTMTQTNAAINTCHILSGHYMKRYNRFSYINWSGKRIPLPSKSNDNKKQHYTFFLQT